MRHPERSVRPWLWIVAVCSLVTGSVQAEVVRNVQAEGVGDAAQGQWVSAGIPVAAHQKYMARAIDEAAGQLNLEGVEGRTLSVEVSGIVGMSEPDLWNYARHSIEARVALAGGRVVPEGGEGRILVRLPQAGIDRVVIERREEVRKKRSSGKGALVAGLASMAAGLFVGSRDYCNYETCISGWQRSRMPVVMIGFGAGMSLFGLNRMGKPAPVTYRTIKDETFRARVDMEVTVIPREGDPWSTHGSADVLIPAREAGAQGEVRIH